MDMAAAVRHKLTGPAVSSPGHSAPRNRSTSTERRAALLRSPTALFCLVREFWDWLACCDTSRVKVSGTATKEVTSDETVYGFAHTLVPGAGFDSGLGGLQQ